MLRSLLFVSALLFSPLSPTIRPIQDAAAAPAATPTPPDTKNPVKPTADSKAKAKKMYGYDCEMCHNANGDGKSDLAKDMSLSLTDFTDPKTLSGKSDAELFDIIKNGKGQMPGEGDREKTEDLWNMVILVRSFARK